MFVTNHVLSGVLIGRAASRRPVAAFALGVGSHLVLDAIPHWGCDTAVPGGTDRFLRVAKRDGLLGLALLAVATVAVGRRARAATIAAMAGAILLDLDKPCWYFFRIQLFPDVVNRIHARAQNESPAGMRNEFAYGIAFAVVDAAVTAGRRPYRRLPRVAGRRLWSGRDPLRSPRLPSGQR
jgi:hypothetical protein